VRRMTSRKAGHLGLFTRARMMLAKGRDLDLITQAESLEEMAGLRADLTRFSYACYVGELADRMTQEGEDEGAAPYEALRDTLRWLSDAEDLALGVRHLELRLLAYAGLQPELYACVECKARLQAEVNHFGASLGGFLCPRCAPGQDGLLSLSVNAQKVLRFLASHPLEALRGLRVGPATHEEVERVLLVYLEYSLERETKSLSFLRQVRQQREPSSGEMPPSASAR
jgi:DNA repair protein RecO (recombination protein O)